MYTLLLLALTGCRHEPATGKVNAGTAVCTTTECALSLALRLDDLRGRPVTSGLSADQFQFDGLTLEGDGEYTITGATPTGLDAETTDGGVIAPIVVDQSGSMGDNDPDELRLSAAAATADALLAEDAARVAVFAFPRQQDLGEFEEVDLVTDYTDDGEVVDEAIEALAGEEGGGTPLYDALIEVLAHQVDSREDDEQSALIVLTDGSDSSSAAEAEDVAAAAAEAGVRLYVAGLGDSVDFEELGTLAASTGGVFVPAADADALEETLAGLAGAVYGNVTLSATLTLDEGSDPLTEGWYRLAGSVSWEQIEMALDLQLYLSDVEDAS